MRIGKKLLSVLLAVCLILTLVPMSAFAASAPPFGGSGTKDDPWLVTSADDLVALANFVNSGNAQDFDAEGADAGNFYGYYFRQTQNIDLSGVDWDPIGYTGDFDLYFAGNYDGNGHTISNAVSDGKVDDDGYASVGIFGWAVYGTIENLTVSNANFTATSIGPVYNYAGGIAGVCLAATIRNCVVKDSHIEGINTKQNHCAGGVAGYAASGTLENCGAENNAVQSMAYAGGLVGENNDDDGDGTATSFKNCYVANGSVISKIDVSNGVSFAGGFIGQFASDEVLAENCYVYNTTISTEGTAVTGLKSTGVFAGHIYTNGSTYTSVLKTENCYYGACGTEENSITAAPKTAEEFADGTVANLLGEAFTQKGGYPVTGSPDADYSAVDAAIAKAEALDKTLYEDFSGVEAAVAAVERGKAAGEQAEVDAMAQAIEAAIGMLQYRNADYQDVDDRIAEATALDRSLYKDFSGVESAIAAVVRGLKINAQDEVDAMAEAIKSAIDALEFRDADYTKVDAAIAKVNALDKDEYANFDLVEEAVAAVVRGKKINEQADVDAMAQAIEDAIQRLEMYPHATPTAAPSADPTTEPTAAPSATPTTAPTATPTAAPSATPTTAPTATPTPAPKADTNNPKTGSSNLPVIFGGAALIISGGALATILIYRKKRQGK